MLYFVLTLYKIPIKYIEVCGCNVTKRVNILQATINCKFSKKEGCLMCDYTEEMTHYHSFKVSKFCSTQTKASLSDISVTSLNVLKRRLFWASKCGLENMSFRQLKCEKNGCTVFHFPSVKKCKKIDSLPCFTLRAKVFRGRKIHGEFDIKVEQVGFTSPC